MIARRLASLFLVLAFVGALVPCAPAGAQAGCAMRRGCPMRAAHGCKTEHSAAFDCCRPRGDRAPAPPSSRPAASPDPATALVDVAVAVPRVEPATPPPAAVRLCDGVERYTLFRTFLI